MSWLSKGTKAVGGGFGNVLQGVLAGRPAKQMPGSVNPFAPPDLSFLKDPFSMLKNYKPVDTSGTDATFKELLGVLGGQDQNDTEKLNQILGDIGIQEKNTVGNLKSDFLDRGLGGPNQISDIEANALAQARSGADRTRAEARTTMAGAGLDRLASAYGTKYAGGLDTAKTNAAAFNDLLKSETALNAEQKLKLAQLISDLYSGGAQRQIAGYVPKENSAIEDIIRNVKLGFNFGGQ